MRESMVTRTVTETTIAIKCANTEAEVIETVTATVPGAFKSDDAIKRAARKVIKDQKHLVFISATVTEERETLYGMTEAEFVANATVLPHRAKKAE